MKGHWCQPGDVPGRKWMLVFEDADRGVMLFDDEDEARKAFEQANESWDCYLFAAAPRRQIDASGSDPS